MGKGKGQHVLEHSSFSFEFQLPDGKDILQTTGCPKKEYTSLKSKIFVQRTDQSVKLVSFISRVLSTGGSGGEASPQTSQLPPPQSFTEKNLQLF